MPEQRHHPTGPQRSALIITNVIKISGLVLAVKAGFFSHGHPDPTLLIVSAFMMSGAQGLEGLLDKLLGK